MVGDVRCLWKPSSVLFSIYFWIFSFAQIINIDFKNLQGINLTGQALQHRYYSLTFNFLEYTPLLPFSPTYLNFPRLTIHSNCLWSPITIQLKIVFILHWNDHHVYSTWNWCLQPPTRRHRLTVSRTPMNFNKTSTLSAKYHKNGKI